MKTSPALAVAVFAHAMLIGVLVGMSRSPIVGVVLPLLLGVGGYRLLDTVTGDPDPDGRAPLHLAPAMAWLVALWCFVAVISVFTGIALRTGSIHFGPARVSTLSLIRLDQQPPARVPELVLVCEYYDRLDLSPAQKRALAPALSDTTVVPTLLLSSLKDFFVIDQGAAVTKREDYGVFDFHRQGPP